MAIKSYSPAQVEAFKQKLKEQYRSRSDVQSFNRLTREERARRAINLMVKNQIEHARLQGQEMTETQAVLKIMDMIRLVERKRDFGEIQ